MRGEECGAREGRGSGAWAWTYPLVAIIISSSTNDPFAGIVLISPANPRPELVFLNDETPTSLIVVLLSILAGADDGLSLSRRLFATPFRRPPSNPKNPPTSRGRVWEAAG